MAQDGQSALRLRLRAAAAPLLALPWRQPLPTWSPQEVGFVDVPLAAGRHVVRVVEVERRLWALKELPRWAAEREHAALTEMHRRGVPAVRPAGMVTRGRDADAVLVTEYLSDSVPWRSLLLDPSGTGARERTRTCEAVADFLVELHRRGVFWGDGSLANLLFRRDGQQLQPVLVDAETAEVRPALTDGQRRADLQILQDNTAGGLLDVAAELHRPVDLDALAVEVGGIAERYDRLWAALHAEPTLPFGQREAAVAEVRRLNDLGYAVDEVRLTSLGDGRDLRLHTVVASRRHHAAQLRQLTGLQVGEGQAAVLLDDLRRHGRARPEAGGQDLGRSWLQEVLLPALERLSVAVPDSPDLVQDYCDLLEARWLLSERAGHDVGDDAAVRELAAHRTGRARAPALVPTPPSAAPDGAVGDGSGPPAARSA